LQNEDALDFQLATFGMIPWKHCALIVKTVWDLLGSSDNEVEKMRALDFVDQQKLFDFGRLYVTRYPHSKSTYVHIIVCHLVEVCNDTRFINNNDIYLNYFAVMEKSWWIGEVC
jgi:hypothetical protein